MIDPKALLSDLQKLLTKLEDDLRARCESVPDVDGPLRDQYAAAREANRTAQAYEVWRDDLITQAAVAWILGCVFVRFCEDNHLIDPPRLSGPALGGRRERAEDEHTLYFQRHPTHSDREYLLWVFDEVAKLPAMKELFDHRHNPLWSIQVSGDGAMALREFFLRRDPATGLLSHDFSDPAFGEAGTSNPDFGSAGGDPTRFLGDLYQDLSESARKKYALLQTPIFVEDFILDRTLEPAIREFGFQQVRMIDPTCGSGHFLLGGFRRLFDLWVKHEPRTNVRELAQRAFDGIYGVDLNPFAVAIARFRLLVAALLTCGITRLADAPAFSIHLAAGDSLLHGRRQNTIGGRQHYLLGDDPLAHVYDTEDADLLAKYLGQKYHAVVANPPYINPSDRAINEAYRTRYTTCYRQYSLVIPFCERIFMLAMPGGFTGQITGNSFINAEFGKQLIESFFPKVDLQCIIDASGVRIPGHGTPTILLFGRNRPPAQSTVRAVLGKRGDSQIYANPSENKAWRSIVKMVDVADGEDEFVSVRDTPREKLHQHPWTIAGGGIAELKELLDQSGNDVLESWVESIGFYQDTHADEFFVQPNGFARRHRLQDCYRPFVRGDDIRDWCHYAPEEEIFFPYSESFEIWGDVPQHSHFAVLHMYRTTLWDRSTFGGGTYRSAGRSWFEYHQFPRSRAADPRAIAYAFVADRNHYIRVSERLVFGRTAPLLRLQNERWVDAVALQGLLNSSLVCFWLKQVCYPKGGDPSGADGGRVRDTMWDLFFNFNATPLARLPLAKSFPVDIAGQLDDLGRQLSDLLPSRVIHQQIPTTAALIEARRRFGSILEQMISLQEELDWQCYGLYGLQVDSPPSDSRSIPPINLGERAFEIVLARRIATGEDDGAWFQRNGSSPMTEIPAAWPEGYKLVVRRRIEVIESDRNIALIERPEYKRRWNTESWDTMQERAVRSWLLDRLEGWPLANEGLSDPRSLVWDEQDPRLMSVAQLADRLRQDKDFMLVAAVYREREDFDLTKLVAELVADEAVPFLPMLRYKESGLRNRRVWEQTWDLQRQEDAIDARAKLPPTDPQHLTEQQAKAEKKAKVGDIPVPPKYKSADMLPGPTWRLRGKLDVPKERFVSFPHCQRDADPTLVITWAGYDHLQQMQALAAYYMDVKEREGWPADRRVPLLAGLLELLPWVLQWHNAPDPANDNLHMGNYYRDFINEEAREVGKTTDEIRSWVPPAKDGRGRRAK